MQVHNDLHGIIQQQCQKSSMRQKKKEKITFGADPA
jgi:hypothetical protein